MGRALLGAGHPGRGLRRRSLRLPRSPRVPSRSRRLPARRDKIRATPGVSALPRVGSRGRPPPRSVLAALLSASLAARKAGAAVQTAGRARHGAGRAGGDPRARDGWRPERGAPPNCSARRVPAPGHTSPALTSLIMDGHSAPDPASRDQTPPASPPPASPPPAGPRPRPRSYLSPSGVLVTDFPVHDGPGQVSDGGFDVRTESRDRAGGGESEARGPPSPHQRRPESPPTPGSPLLTPTTPAANTRAAGQQQLIPRALASESRARPEPHRRLQKMRSLVDALGAAGPGPVAPPPRTHAGPELDSPGSLRRGLRSTSYRRAVVSGLDLDSTSTSKKKNRMSQPALKAVAEDRERFASLGRIKKKMLKGQGTFDGEGNAVLYQNYKEKALDADSEEESESNEQKADDSTVVHPKPVPSTWSQLSAVRRNGLSQTVSQEERKRQEAILEVISSERSYLLSLHTLIRMFKDSQELGQTMTKTERHHLFSNITDVCEASKRFFMELEARHHSGTFIDDISDIVEKHAASAFEPYVRYCTNEVYQQRTLQRLLDTNPPFKEVLSRIEAHEDCRNLPIISFLILPMQRVTRLPLLMDTICQKTPKDSPKYDVCRRALREASKLVRLCNEGARKMERTELLCTINSQLEFRIKPFPLVSASRWLVKRGELTAFAEDSGLFSRKPCRHHVYFFLFNDVLIITKRKSDESYVVTDYSLRDQLQVECCDSEEPVASPSRGSPATLQSRLGATSRLFTLTALSNHAGERVQLLLGAETQSERARWIWALGQSSRKPPPDRASLTQVEIIRSFTAKQPDELSLQVADVVLIHQRVGDGWYEGERLRDAERGWFPMECAREITCRATIDKNMERMGRLLALETHV